ncbi:gag protease polyprotein [Tanacetum coccineum]
MQIKNTTKIKNEIFRSAPVFLENKEGLLIVQKVRRTFTKNRRTFLSEPNQNAKNSYFAKGLFELKIAINMDSSMGKMCLGKDVIEISSDRNEGSGDWDSPEYKDTAGSRGKKEPEALVFHKMYTKEDSDRDEEGKLNLDDLETLLDFDFDEVPQIETDLPPMAGRPNHENSSADTGSDTNTMPYRIYEQLGRDDIMKEDRNITMINYTEAEVTGRLRTTHRDVPIVVGRGFLNTIGGNIDIPNRIFTTFDGRTRQTFRAAKSEKIRIAESDSDDEEDYVIKRNDMGTPIHNSRPIGYQNNTNPAENMTLSTLESVINPFRKISVWKKAVSFLGSLPAKLRDVEWKPDYKLCYSNPELATGQWKTEIRTYDHEAGSSRAKRSRNVETVEEALLPDVHHEFLEWRGCSREAKSRYNSRLATLLPKLIYSPQIVDWQLLHKIGCGDEIDQMLKISLKEAQSDEEIFFCGLVCADDELQSKKIISFRLGGRAHSLTLLEFARRLGLYHAEELNEEGFDAYFQGGLRSDENFNAREYWERISIDRDLHLSRSSITSVRFPILRVLHKMITYGLCQRTTGYEKIQRNDLWLLSMFEDRHQNGYANVAWVIAKWMKRKGAGSQKDSQICCGQFISKIARKSKVLTEETIRSLSTLVYYRDLDRTTLRELIDSEDRLIPEILVDDVPREAIERMEYRHAYHWDRYQGVFEHMAGVYSIPLQGAYNPPGYAQL